MPASVKNRAVQCLASIGEQGVHQVIQQVLGGLVAEGCMRDITLHLVYLSYHRHDVTLCYAEKEYALW